MIRATILALTLYAAILAMQGAKAIEQTRAHAIAICDTDSECINHCHADDGECDGGPQ